MTDARQDLVLAFDVYGTLIDPFRMEEHRRAAFGDRAREASELWRAKQLEYSFRRALMKQYANFGVCTAEALRFVAGQLRVALSPEAQASLLAEYRRLPAFADAAEALADLASAGFRMVAFSNGAEEAVRDVLEHAALLARFNGVVSVDPLCTFKPDPEVYERLLQIVGAPRENVWLVSSNSFDVIGAKACGLRAAWVQRDATRVFDPWDYKPDAAVSSLAELKAVFRAG